MAENRLFLSGDLIQRWVSGGHVELGRAEIRVRRRGRAEGSNRHARYARYAIEEAAHVLVEVSGAGDALGLSGRVRSVRELTELGAEIVDRAMLIGDLAYDIVLGFFASPIGPEAGATPRSVVLAGLAGLSDSRDSRDSDVALLARYLIEKLE